MATGLIVHLGDRRRAARRVRCAGRAHGERSGRLEEGNCLSFEVFVPTENAGGDSCREVRGRCCAPGALGWRLIWRRPAA